MRALVLGMIVALGLTGCESKGTSCRSNGPETCTCVAESSYPDDNTCSPGAGSASICCAQPEWPKTGTCTCRTFYCVADSDTECHCNSVSPDGGTGTASCTGTHCCLAATQLGTKFACSCGDSDCPDGTTEVTQCTPATLATSAYCTLVGSPDGGMPGATSASTCR